MSWHSSIRLRDFVFDSPLDSCALHLREMSRDPRGVSNTKGSREATQVALDPFWADAKRLTIRNNSHDVQWGKRSLSLTQERPSPPPPIDFRDPIVLQHAQGSSIRDWCNQTLKTCGQRYTRPRGLPWPGLLSFKTLCLVLSALWSLPRTERVCDAGII
jgi:hypothetical protein